MMKIAFLNAYGNGSTGKIVDLLKKECEHNGIIAHSYYAREFCATPETSTKIFSRLGFYCDALKTRVFDNHGLNNKHSTKRLLKELDKYKPDILHIHNLHSYWLNYEILFRYIKGKNLKVVFTLHDCWSFTGHCTHFDFVGCEKWKTGCKRCPQKKMFPKSVLFDNSKRNYERKKKAFTSLPKENMVIVTPSEWLKSKVADSFLNKYDCIVINNGIDTDVFRNTESDLREEYGIGDKKLILAVANYWDERKGLKYFLELADIKKDWSFVYIGREKVKTDRKYDNVIHIERTDSQTELAKWYSTADVFVNPTLEDNYPTTNLEAIACGTPVITFDTGGSPEIVEKTGFGEVVKEKTTDALFKALNKFLNRKDTDSRVERDVFGADAFVKAYCQAYLKIFNSTK